ncbi:Stf0 family sulfotransferase [Paracoccus sp. S1E-3]|uniref:Stf0 family sulfotransferase n=1 Tax=Paracoccus sp. S1E-3 TaxID=2756130 RepID=UPI0015EEFF40|nr:Stf0 family sulfotransferase [Paracoccus sp. S1E-3]MBA4491493.1 hypothetical protein [Paracoccus sp. S1E-3]
MLGSFSSGELFQALSRPGQHEVRINDLFSGNVRFDGKTPVFDRPLVIMAFSNRSGSNLLADYLRQTRRFAGFAEALNWDEVSLFLSKKRISSFPEYIETLARGAPPRSIWGVKASWDQMAMLTRANIFGMFPEVKVIHSVRRDVLGQATSHWIAHQTGKWTSTHNGTSAVPVFDSTAIERILMGIHRSNGYVDCICQAMHWPRIPIFYENVQQNMRLEIERIAKFMGVSIDDWQPAKPRISMQRDDTNATFKRECFARWRGALTGQP